jgi:hypothetical protein
VARRVLLRRAGRPHESAGAFGRQPALSARAQHALDGGAPTTTGDALDVPSNVSVDQRSAFMPPCKKQLAGRDQLATCGAPKAGG